jgi:hypothetical protein
MNRHDEYKKTETETNAAAQAAFSYPAPSADADGTIFRTFAHRLDITPVKYKLVREKGWTPERADRVEPEYKAFLYLTGTQDNRWFVPTHDIDEMWHAHILDTRKYMADCADHFGAYIHHYPYMGMEDAGEEQRARRLFEETRAAMRGLASMADAIGQNAADCSSCSSSSCSSSSCSGGSSCSSHSSCSSGHGTHDSGNTDGETPASPLSSCSSSSCSSSSRDDKPGRDKGNDRGRNKTPNRPPEKRRGILRRILGLSPLAGRTVVGGRKKPGRPDKWQASVLPSLFGKGAYRPDADDYEKLSGKISIH